MAGVARGGVVGGADAEGRRGRWRSRGSRGGAARLPEARSGAVERRAPAMALVAARAAGAGEGSGGLRDAGGGRRGPGGGAEGPAWACGPAAAAMWSCHVARCGWRRRAAADASGRGRTRPSARIWRGCFFLGFRGEGEIRKRRGVYIGIEGARRVQMRCGFRPHDRDRTL